MSFPAYTSYKESGEEWLGAVPAHWSLHRLKWSVASCRNGIWGDEADGGDDDVVCVRVADFDRPGLRIELDEPTRRKVTQKERAGRLLERGNLLLEKSGGGEGQPVGAVMLFDEEVPAVCSNFVARMKLAVGMEPSYWRYVHAAAYSVRLNTRSIKQTSGIQNLDQSQYLDELGPFPPPPEQTAIAAFLDRETGKIDALVEEQRRLIELLKEKRQAVISHVVTKGLNPDAPMRPSGIEWLGDVPEHWEVCLLKRAFREVDYGISDSLDSEGDVAVLRMGNIDAGRVLLDDLKYVDEVDPSLLLQDGDLLFNRTNSLDLIGKVGRFITTEPVRVSFASYLVRLRLHDTSSSRFFVFLLNTHGILGEARARAFVAIGQCNLNPTRYGQIVVAIPPRDEQEEIADFLTEQTDALDALISEAQTAITLLQERRSALISAAVTGKIDVRGLVSAETEAA